MHPESGQFAIRCAALSDQFKRIARYEDQESRIYDKYAKLLFVDADVTEKDRPEVDRGQLRQMLLDSLPSGVCLLYTSLSGAPANTRAAFDAHAPRTTYP